MLALSLLALNLPSPIMHIPAPGISIASKKEGIIIKSSDKTQFFGWTFFNFLNIQEKFYSPFLSVS